MYLFYISIIPPFFRHPPMFSSRLHGVLLQLLGLLDEEPEWGKHQHAAEVGFGFGIFYSSILFWVAIQRLDDWWGLKLRNSR
jgi:hypothetical protein